MASLGTIAQTIADNIGKPFDELLLERLKYEIISKRATLVRNDFTKNKIVYPQLVQDIGCIDMEKTSSSECCSIDLGDDCKVSKSIQKVPSPIRLKENSSPFTYVGGVNKSTPFTWTLPEKIPYMLGRRYGKKNQLYYTYLNEHIYVFHLYSQSAVEKISLRAVWEDPVALAKLKNCNGEQCIPETEFPIPRDMEDAIKRLIYDELRAMDVTIENEIPIDEDTRSR